MTSLRPSGALDFADVLRPGDHVAWPQGTGEPTGLTARLLAQSEDLKGIVLVLGMVTSSTLDHAGLSNFKFLCLNGAARTRKAAALARDRIVPAHLSAIPDLIVSRRLPIDVVLVRVRPTANPGVFSLGVMVDFVHEMIASARVVIAELDERMPLTSGDTLITRDSITLKTLADREEVSMPDACPTQIDCAVAQRVAHFIPDRATVQFGVGGIPVAVARALGQHRDLGLHSGIIPDAAVDLIEAGVISNRFKGIDEGISVTGGLFGTRKLFDLAHENPEIRLRRARYTHAAATLAQIKNLHTINSAIAIDLSGQVNSEVAGGRYVGAVGGQVDFVRGARLSSGGRSIIALASTTPDGRHSKIVASLEGQPVTTARSDVDIVITEHGIADLWGLDLSERAKALIAIADPQFRHALSYEHEAA